MNKRVLAAPAVFLALLVAAAAGGCSEGYRYGSIDQSLPTISVQGSGKVRVAPDEAVARFGVTSDDKKLERAYKLNTESMNDVIKAVKVLGVKDADITTSSYNVAPVYPTDERGRRLPGKPASFRVSQELTVKIREIDKTGSVIDKAVSGGTNTFNGLSFGSSRIEQLKKEAKSKAAADARENAALMAKSLGVKLGRVLKVSGDAQVPYPARNMAAFKADSMAAAPRIEPGTMEVTAACSVIYEIVQ